MDAYESLKQSLVEMQLIRNGKKKGKTWQELSEELKKKKINISKM